MGRSNICETGGDTVGDCRARQVLLIAALATLATVGMPTASGADQTWRNTGTDFNTAANWISAVPGTADVAIFSGVAAVNPNLSAPVTVLGLSFSTPDAAGYTLGSANGSSLKLTNTGTAATSAIYALNTSGVNTITGPLILGAAANSTATFTQAVGGTLALTGPISSTNAITGVSFAAGGTYTLSGTNSYNGTTTVGSATLNINSASALGTGNLVTGNNASVIDNTSSAAVTVSNVLTLGNNLTFTGTKNLTLGGLNVTAQKQLTVSGGTLTISGPSAFTGGFNKNGAGTLVLNGAGTGTGSNGYSVRVDAGTVIFGNASAAGTGVLGINGGTIDASTPLTLANTGQTIGGNFTFAGSNALNLGSGVATIAADRIVTLNGSNSSLGFGTLNNTANGNRTITVNGISNTLSFTGLVTYSGTAANNTLAGQGRAVAFIGTGNLTISGAITNGSSNTFGALNLLGSGTSTLGGANAFSNGLQVGGGGVVVFNSVANGGVSVAASTTPNAGATTVTVASATGIAVGQAITGVGVPDGTTVTAISGNTLTLSQAFMATAAATPTYVIGQANALGIGTNANTNVVLGNTAGATLRYTGPTASTDRAFQIGTSVAGQTVAIESSGAGPINFTSTGNLGFKTTNLANTLALGGTNAGINTFAKTIVDNGTGITSVAKNGVGTWSVTALSSYTGGTAINNGTLLANNATRSLGTGTTTVNSGGVLAGGTTATPGVTGGPVMVNSGGIVTAGTGATRVAAAGSASGSTVGTLTSGDQTWAVGGTQVVKFASAGTFDLLNMAMLNLGALSSGKFTIVLTYAANAAAIATPTDGTQFKIGYASGKITNGTTAYADGSNLSSLFTLDTSDIGLSKDNFRVFAINDGGGQDLMLQYNDPQAAPEPTALLLFGLGASVGLTRRSRRASPQAVPTLA